MQTVALAAAQLEVADAVPVGGPAPAGMPWPPRVPGCRLPRHRDYRPLAVSSSQPNW